MSMRTRSHPFDQVHDHAPGGGVDAAHELRPVGDEHLAVALHDVDAAARQVQDLAQRAEGLARVGLDGDAEQRAMDTMRFFIVMAALTSSTP